MSERRRQDSLVGTWILDQYHIIEEIAEGGMGRVYLAEQAAMDRYAAIKILPAQLGAVGQTRRRRFRQEARAASRLTHANIVTAYNFGELADGTMFFAMEYIQGRSLADMLMHNPLPLVTAIDIAYQCAAALTHAHVKGVVHRDFKPENVMVTETASGLHVKVVDFGIAHIIEDDTLTRTGELVGTPRYVSPEQCRGDNATPKSDQYAFGLALYEMVKGEPAFHAESTLGYLHCHQHVPAPRLALVDQSVPAELADLVARTLSKAPDDRFPSMKEVHRELSRLAKRLVDGDAPLGRDIVRRHHVTTPMPGVVAWLGERGPMREVAESLGAIGLLLADHFRGVNEAMAAVGTYDAAIVALSGKTWRKDSKAWTDAALDNLLVCVDTDVDDADIDDMAQRFRHICVGRHPLDPVVVSTALSWMLRPGKPGVQNLFPNDPIQLVQIRSAEQKASAIDALVDDASAQGLRRQTRLGLGEVAEELLINALYHAPESPAEQAPESPDEQGFGAGASRVPRVSLSHGREVTLSWVIDKRYIAVSVRDRFGTLTRERLFSYASGKQEAVRHTRESRPQGMGVGLQLVSRVARHVIAALSPDRWCEILVLIDRREAAHSRERTLTAITHAGWNSVHLGGGLLMRTFVHGKARHVQLEGDLSEQAVLEPVFDWDGDTRIDLSRLRRVNSMGVRNWVDAARRRPVGNRVTFERCAVTWVRQLAMLPELNEIGEVVSVQLPYHCDHCNEERTLVMPTRELFRDEPPPARCTACGHPMEFDDAWEAYVAFQGDRPR